MDYKIEIQRRAYQRSVGVIVNPNGVVKVTAGLTTPKFYIKKVLKEYQDWIYKNLSFYEELKSRFPRKKFTEGEEILFKGEPKTLTFAATSKKRPFVQLEGDYIIVYSEQVLDKAETKKTLLKFYKKQGVAWLTQMVEEESQAMGLYPSKLSFRAQKSRWGSCSSRGAISLNWKLIGAPDLVARYVVVHELAHLEHQDHSKRFWTLVDKYCPDLKKQKGWFKTNAYSLDFLSEKSELYSE